MNVYLHLANKKVSKAEDVINIERELSQAPMVGDGIIIEPDGKTYEVRKVLHNLVGHGIDVEIFAVEVDHVEFLNR